MHNDMIDKSCPDLIYFAIGFFPPKPLEACQKPGRISWKKQNHFFVELKFTQVDEFTLKKCPLEFVHFEKKVSTGCHCPRNVFIPTKLVPNEYE